MGGVAVVTDHTCDLPRDLVESIGLRVVPLSVTFGDRSYTTGMDLQAERFYELLATSSRQPTTSQPAPVWFDEAYADCIDDGYDAIVSVHCSSVLSGTVSLARDRARHVDLPVEVVDSKLVGGSLGLAALAAHRTAQAGGDVREVVAAAERVRAASRSFVLVDTLEHLKRGGRLTGAQAAVGTALKVKPVLHLTAEGRVEVLERTRTWSRALGRVATLVEEAAGGRPVDAVVVHAAAPERAADLWAAVEDRVSLVDRHDALIGPIVGTHVGPGAVGIAIVPRR